MGSTQWPQLLMWCHLKLVQRLDSVFSKPEKIAAPVLQYELRSLLLKLKRGPFKSKRTTRDKPTSEQLVVCAMLICRASSAACFGQMLCDAMSQTRVGRVKHAQKSVLAAFGCSQKLRHNFIKHEKRLLQSFETHKRFSSSPSGRGGNGKEDDARSRT